MESKVMRGRRFRRAPYTKVAWRSVSTTIRSSDDRSASRACGPMRTARFGASVAGGMKLSIQTVTMMSARHPWRTIAVWVGLVVVGVVSIGALLGGALTTEGKPTNNPQSQRAKHALSAAFRPTGSAAVTDIVVVRSPRYTVDAPEFKALVGALAADVRRAGVASLHTYLDRADPSLVTRDRHATM